MLYTLILLLSLILTLSGRKLDFMKLLGDVIWEMYIGVGLPPLMDGLSKQFSYSIMACYIYVFLGEKALTP